MSLSHVACSIPASPTVALNEEARLLREKGEPVIHLGIGEPKNKTPIAAILSSAAKLTAGRLSMSLQMVTRRLKRRSSATQKITMIVWSHHKISLFQTELSNRCGMFCLQS